jgi:hypothetical protein
MARPRIGATFIAIGIWRALVLIRAETSGWAREGVGNGTLISRNYIGGPRLISGCVKKTASGRRARLVEDTIQEVVERIHRYGDRERNVGNLTEEREAREAALDAQHALTVEEALRIEAALQDDDDVSVVPGQEVVKKKKRGWLQRLFGGGDDDDAETDNS